MALSAFGSRMAFATIETASEHRQRVQKLLVEGEQQRQVAVNQQRSSSLTPPQRIRHWERLHSTALPSASNHALLQVIAQQTDLMLEQVQAEQQRRVVYLAAKAAGGVKAVQ
jgi:hypothetical protein